MTRRSRHILAAISVAVVAAATGIVAIHLAGAPAAPAPAVGEGEMPTALGRHLDRLKALPGNQGMSLEGPGSAAEAAYFARAYPADTICRRAGAGSQGRVRRVERQALPARQGTKGNVDQRGPEQRALPDPRSSSTRSSTCPTTTSRAAAPRRSPSPTPACQPTAARGSRRPAAASGAPTTPSPANPQVDYLGGPLGINAAGAVTIDTNDPTGNTIYVGHRRGEHLRIRLRGRRRPLQVDQRRRHLDRAARQGRARRQGHRRDRRSSRATPTPSTWARPRRCAACRASAAPASPGPPRTPRSGASTSPPTAAPRGRSSTTDRPTPADCTGDADRVRTTARDRARRAACATSRSTRRTRTSSTRPRSRVASGARRTAARPGPRSSRRSTRRVIQTRPNLAVTTLPNGKTRMYVYEGNAGRPLLAAVPQRRRRDRRPDVHRPDQRQRRRHRLRHGSTCATRSAGTTRSSTRRPDTRTSSTSEVDYSYGETIANKRGVVMSTDAGVSGTDMTFDGTDALHPNGLHPDQHDIVTHPNNPFQFIEVNDGGVDAVQRLVRRTGPHGATTRTAACPERRWPGASRCCRASRRSSTGINKGLSTLQFMSLSVSPHNSNLLQGGTQDNGTWQTNGNPVKWENMMIGDGGQSGFDVGDPNFRFHTFTGRERRRQLQQRQHRRLDLDRRPDVRCCERRVGVLLPGHQRPGGERHDVRRDGLDRVPHEDVRSRQPHDRRGERDLQRMDRHLRGDLW